ncbi:hypothetical protein Bca52824_015859 [Brassica carinata]|uniref:Uncharacterized protein n=1 Tax=Brassica carinata TaxID=52824 RepID=A0A8X7W418_BRACI|nr:hypothetical protein Bca52824_015859 [Brassica carinata]
MSVAFVRLFSELLLKYSEYVSSRKKGNSTSPLKTFLTEKLPNYAASYVKSYVSACQDDPELKSFDSSLHLQTSNLIRSFNAGGGKTEDVIAMGDPFGDEFLEQCASVCTEQLRLLEKFPELQVELDKKQKNVKRRRRLATIVFGAAYSHFLPCLWIWVNGMMKDYEEALESKIDLLRLTQSCTKSNMEAMKTIRNLVENLITRISSILKTVEGVQTRDEEAVKLAMQVIIKNVDGFAEKIEEVGENVAKCSKLVASGKVRVLEYITSSVSL